MIPVGSLDRPRRSAARRSSAEKRQSIMAASLRLFIDVGYERTRIGDICEASGFSVGSIYHFFGSKSEIAAELCAFGARDWAAAVAEPMRTAPTAEAAVQGYVRAFFDWVAVHPDLYNFVNDHRVEAASSAARSEIGRAHAALEEALVARLGAEASAGNVRSMPTDVLRAIIDGPCIAYLLWWSRNRGEMSSMREQIAAMVWNALAADGTEADTVDPRPERDAFSKIEAAVVERMWRAGARGAETRERILAVALSCFTEFGFERTSVLDIARQADIAVGTIYHHFGSKEGIAAAWCAEAWGDWYRTLGRVLEIDAPPPALIRRLVLTMFDWVEVNADLYAFIYDVRRIATARPRVDHFESARSHALQRVGAALAGPMARGEVRPMTPHAFLAIAHGSCLGYAVPWSARRDGWGDAPALIADAVWRAVRGRATISCDSRPAVATRRPSGGSGSPDTV
ncbi:MAG: TetR/AcrR family transcriptional regulator [Alphaproteobacteria bacterium]